MNKLLFVLAFFATAHGYALANDKTTISVLVEAHLNQKPQSEYCTSLQNHLSIGMPANNIEVLCSAGSDSSILYNKVAEGEVDYVVANPVATVQLSQLYNTTPLLTRHNSQGKNVYGSVFFTSSSSEIHNLSTINELTIAANNKDGGAWLFGYAHLMEKINYPHGHREFKKTSFLGNDESVVRNVISGPIDVGIVRTGVLEGLIQSGVVKEQDLRILEPGNSIEFGAYTSTSTYPEWALSSTTASNQLQTSEIIELFKGFHTSRDTFKWGELADYDIVKQQLRRYRMGIYQDPVHISYFKQNYPFILSIFFLIFFIYLYFANKVDKKLFKYKTRLERLSVNSSMNRLLAEVTHELSQPITSIRIDAEIIKDMSFDKDLNKNELQKVSDSMSYKTQQCVDIISNIRSLVANKEIKPEVFDIKTRISGIVDLVKAEAMSNKIEIQDLNLMPAVSAYMRPIEFDQVLLNLFKNAISAIINNQKDRNFIKLVLKQDKAFAYLYVEDSGGIIQEPGMLFKLFKSSKTMSEKEGFGLGLNLSRNIMRSHEGDLSLESTTISGSIFMLKIPKIHE